MGFKTRFPFLALSVLMAFSGQASALGLGEIQSESRLGEGLKARIPLRLQAGEFVPAECFRLVKPEGDLPWLKQGSFSRRDSMLLLKSERPVVEPILQVAIQVVCGYDLQREYTLMLSPPVQGAVVVVPERRRAEVPPQGGRRILEGETPASVAAELYPDSRADQRRFIQALIRANRHLGLKSSLGGRQALPEGEVLSIPELPPPPPLPRPSKAEPPLQRETRLLPRPPLTEQPNLPVLQETQGDRLVLSSGGGDFLEAPLRLSHELGVVPGDQVSEALLVQRKLLRLEYRMLAFLENQAETAHLPPEDRLKALEAVLGEAAPQSAPAPAPSPSVQEIPAAKATARKPEPMPEPEGNNFWLWLVGAAGLLGAGALGWREWRRRRQNEAERSEEGDFYFSPSLLEPSKAEVDPFDELEAPVTPRRVVKEIAPPEAEFAHSVLDDIPAPEPLVAELPAAKPLGPESRLDASVDEVFTHNPVMELAEIMLSFGRVKGAAQALKEYIDQNPKEALQPWVKLLEVYRLADMKDEFEALAKSLNENFNVELLHWSDMPKADEPGAVDFVLELVPQEVDVVPAASRPQSIEAMPHICERIQACWGTPQCLEYIQSLLRDNRGGSRQGFPLLVVDELLFLSELLRHEVFQDHLVAPDIDLGADDL